MVIRARPKILFVPSGGKIAPATRYRIYQILPFLKKEGFDYKVYSIFSEGMTSRMIRSSTFGALHRVIYYIQVFVEKIIRTWGIIFLANRFDLVFLQRTTLPLGLGRLLKARNKNILFDIDDPVYLPDKKEDDPVAWIKRYIKKKEVISILRISECVIVENNYIKSFVQKYCKKVYLITGPIDTVKNFAERNKSNSEEIIIGWIGTPSTTPYLRILDEVLKKISKRYKIKVRLIGACPYLIHGLNVESVKWDEESEVEELHKFDIGVMPMPDNEWTRGKVGCKMLQYMANAIPAVVSHTPTTAEIIEDGVNGFLASSEQEWIDKISLLIDRPDIRERIRMKARKDMEEKFSVETSISQYLEIFKDCACGKDI